MKPQLNLSPNEVLGLEPLLASLSHQAHQPISLDLLVKKWSEFVAEVEKGYDDSIYEYTNDLSTRDLLQQIMDASNSTLRDKVLNAIQPWDNRLSQATRKVTRSLLSDRKHEQSWWWFRIPVNPGSELENDLRGEGIL